MRVRFKTTRLAIALVLSFYILLPIALCQEKVQPERAYSNCVAQRDALSSGVYVGSVLDEIRPPKLPPSALFGAGITISVQFGPETKVFLRTDAHNFEVWRGKAEVAGNNVWNFLEGVADNCQLPPDPKDAVKLLNVHWEEQRIKKDEFTRLYKNFITALRGYVYTVDQTSSYVLSEHREGGGVDQTYYTIVYESSWKHFKIDELDLPISGKQTSLIKWIHELQMTMDQMFHEKPDSKLSSK